jgi:transposase
MRQITLLSGPERRRRWPEEEQRTIVAAAFAPGASVAAVARQYDVATSLIYKWRRQARSADRSGMAFAPAVMVNEPPGLPDKVGSEDEPPIRVTLPDGTRVEIGARASVGWVAAIVRALR